MFSINQKFQQRVIHSLVSNVRNYGPYFVEFIGSIDIEFG